MERPTCKTCPYYDSEDWHEQESGHCRRMPPEGDGHDSATDVLMGSWPLVSCFDWCGEHPDMKDYVKATRETPPA